MVNTDEVLCSSITNPELLQQLLDLDNVYTDRQLDLALKAAISRGQIDSVKILLATGTALSKSVITSASRSGLSAVFQEFLNHGWEIDSTKFGINALSLSVEDEQLVKWLLEHNANPEAYKASNKVASALVSACFFNSVEILDLLINNGAELNPDAIYKAMTPDRDEKEGRIEIIRFLISRGISIDSPATQRRNIRYSPLFYAVGMQEKEMVEVLLDAGADPNIRDYDGFTPAQYALNNGYNEIYDIFAKRNLVPIDGPK